MLPRSMDALPQAGFGQDGIPTPQGQGGKQVEVLVEEKGQPDAFPPAFLADPVHAVVPVAAAHKRQAVDAEAQPVPYGPGAECS